MQKLSIRDLAEGALLAAVTAVLALMTAYLPVFPLFGVFLTGAPMACLAVRRHTAASVIASAAVWGLCALLLGGVLNGTELFLLTVLPGLAAGICFRKHTGFFTLLAAVCASVLASFLFSFLVLKILTDGKGFEEIIGQSVDMAEQMLVQTLQNSSRLRQIPQETISEAAAEIGSAMKSMIQFYLPTIILVMALVIGYVQVRLYAFFAERTRSGYPDILPFGRMKAPKSMCYLTAALFIMTLFLREGSVFDAALANVASILYFIIGVCGFSFLDAKLSAKLPAGPARFAVYVAAFMLMGMLAGLIWNLLILAGMVDSIFDFRKLGKAVDDDGKEE